MRSLPSDSGVADELRQLRQSLDGLSQRLGALTAENTDLLAQTEHVIELLADCRREIRELQKKGTAI